MLGSKSGDHTIRLWSCETWETVAVITAPTIDMRWMPALAFHPTLPMLAAPSSPPNAQDDERCRQIHLWELDYSVLLGEQAGESAATRAVHHTTGKIVLVVRVVIPQTGKMNSFCNSSLPFEQQTGPNITTEMIGRR